MMTRRRAIVTVPAAVTLAGLGAPLPALSFTPVPYPASILPDWRELGLKHDDSCIDVCPSCPDGYYLTYRDGDGKDCPKSDQVQVVVVG